MKQWKKLISRKKTAFNKLQDNYSVIRAMEDMGMAFRGQNINSLGQLMD